MSELENNLPEENEEDGIIMLTDENGVDTSYEFLDLISYEGQDYVILLPIEDGEDDGAVMILEVHELDDDAEEYASVDDEAVLTAVYNIFKEKYKDYFNFED